MRISDWSSDVCSSDLAGRELARAGQPFVHLFEVPASAHAREDRGEGEAMLAVADFLAQRAKEVRTDAVGAARIDRVARGALREHRLALRRVGGGEQIGERHGRFAAAGASLGILDRIAGLFGTGASAPPARGAEEARGGERWGRTG